MFRTIKFRTLNFRTLIFGQKIRNFGQFRTKFRTNFNFLQNFGQNYLVFHNSNLDKYIRFKNNPSPVDHHSLSLIHDFLLHAFFISNSIFQLSLALLKNLPDFTLSNVAYMLLILSVHRSNSVFKNLVKYT